MTRLLCVVLVGSVVVSACGGSSPAAPTPPANASTLTVAGQTSFSARNEQGQLSATLRSSNGVLQDQTNAATWTSSRPDIAAVSATGLVTALATGTADITATFQGLTGARTVGVSIACEINHTADVAFANQSPTLTFDLEWNGSILVTGLAPGQTSRVFAVASGVLHTFVFRFANSTRVGCRESTATLAQCSAQTITCSARLP